MGRVNAIRSEVDSFLFGKLHGKAHCTEILWKIEENNRFHISGIVQSTVSVLERYEGYTVKYIPSPEGKGVYLTVYTESSPNTKSISF